MLEIQPITFAEARNFVTEHHRHLGPPVGCKFCIAVNDGVKVVGVAIIGRPVARHNDDTYTLEITRLATDGTTNACSCLYSAAARAAKALGYRRIITYTLASEPGTSLRAAGWKVLWKTKGGNWNCPSRPRVDKHPTEQKVLFERAFFETHE